MAADIRLILFDTDDPVWHLSSLEAVWRLSDQGRAPETILVRSLAPCVLIGESQEAREAADLNYCRRHKIPVLRRPSQGGAVFLDQDCLVYSLVLSAAKFGGSTPNELFDRWRSSVIEVLRDYGVDARPRYPNDIEAEGRKIAGLTLTQWYSVYSFSGTLLIKLNQSAMDQALGKAVSHGLTSLEQVRRQKIDKYELAGHLAEGLAKGLNRHLRRDGLTREELELVQDLAANKYGNRKWNIAGSEGP